MSRALIDERTNHFRDFAVWPRQQDLNVELWFDNFQPNEQYIAERLLANFTYFNTTMTDALLKHAIQKFLSDAWENKNFPKPPSQINFDSIIFVTCQGEIPHSADSGNFFSRKLRDILRIPEHNIKSPEEALTLSNKIHHFVFVDDFVGSGNQFIETIERKHEILGIKRSFADLLIDDDYTVSYCTCIATSYALNITVPQKFPHIKIYPAHILTDRHNATLNSSRVWYGMPTNEADKAIELLKDITSRAGYEKSDRGQDAWHGFHGLGLTFAFEHGIPDASLPILFSERNGWKPLKRRPR